MPPISELLKRPDRNFISQRPLATLQQDQIRVPVQGTIMRPLPPPPAPMFPVRCPMPALGTPNFDSVTQFNNVPVLSKTRIIPL